MSFSLAHNGSTLLVSLTGSVDLSESSQIKDNFEKLMSPDISSVTLDAGGVDYIDSSGVASILFINKLCSRSGKGFFIKSISEAGAKVILLAKLESILGLTDSVIRRTDPISINHVSFSELDAVSIFETKKDS
jgi:anti-sigma B factor antagonist